MIDSKEFKLWLNNNTEYSPAVIGDNVSRMKRADSILEWSNDDLDYECIDALDSLLENEFCCLASDPEEHACIFDKAHIVTNAFMAIEAGLRYMGLELISGKWYHA